MDWQNALKKLSVALARLDNLIDNLGGEIHEGRLLSSLKPTLEYLDSAAESGSWEVPSVRDPLRMVKSSVIRPYIDWSRMKLRNLAFRISHKLGEEACVKVPRPENLRAGVEDEPLNEVFVIRRIGSIRSELEMAWLVGVSE